MSNAWQNWARNQRCAPTAIERPENEAEISRIVRDAAAGGKRVKAIGAGHSFTGIALTEGSLLQLDRLQRVIAHDPASKTVTVESGIPLARLNDDLWSRGLAMQNLGDIAYQSIAGATSTATHGSGVTFGGIATQIVAMRMVTADGTVIECSADREPEVFHCADWARSASSHR